jgi:hypothetical protein
MVENYAPSIALDDMLQESHNFSSLRIVIVAKYGNVPEQLH